MADALTELELESLLLNRQVTDSLRAKIGADPQVRVQISRILLALTIPRLIEGGEQEVQPQDVQAARDLWPRILAMANEAAAKQGRTPVPLRLVASSQPLEQRTPADRSATVWAAFINAAGGIGHIRPVVVDVADAPVLSVEACSDCDTVMQAAALRGADAAIALLKRHGLMRLDRSLAVNWLMREDHPTRYEGASIGLAVGVAVFSAVVRVEPSNDVLITGAVDQGMVGQVQGAQRKWEAASRHGFTTFIMPRASLPQLPPNAHARPDLRLVPVDSLEDAIKDLFDSALGLSSKKLAAATDATPAQAARLEVFVTRPPTPASRSLEFSPIRRPDRWYLGDSIAINVRCNRPVHVAVFNHGPSGQVTMLFPSAHEPDTHVNPAAPCSFPPLTLGKPSGIERIIVIASENPIPCPDEGHLQFDYPQWSDQIPSIIPNPIEQVEMSFRVYPAPEMANLASRSMAPDVDSGAMVPIHKPIIADF